MGILLLLSNSDSLKWNCGMNNIFFYCDKVFFVFGLMRFISMFVSWWVRKLLVISYGFVLTGLEENFIIFTIESMSFCWVFVENV